MHKTRLDAPGTILAILLTLLSLFCLSSAVAFSPSGVLALLLLPVFAATALWGHLKFSMTNIFMLTLAVLLSPISDTGVIGGHLWIAVSGLLAFALAYAGLFTGIARLQRTANHK